MTMKTGLEALTVMEYPGRFIILGGDISNQYDIAVYGITGRSASSQARKLVQQGSQILVQPTDESVVNEGNRDLLIYPALIYDAKNSGTLIAVSNGKQTSDVYNVALGGEHAVEILSARSLRQWEYEPDVPNYTPRISGCLACHGLMNSAAISIIKRDGNGSVVRHYFEVPLISGKGKLIATYTGENKDPLPSFRGEPLDVQLHGTTPEEIAHAVYNALAPKDPAMDYRVAVAAVFTHFRKEPQVAIVNRYGGI